MASAVPPEHVVDQPGAPEVVTGALGGGLTVVAFTLVHALWIADIWFNLAPMVISGAACGASIAWSYRETGRHTWAKWATYNGACALLLIGLGAVSFLTLEPRFSLAELIGDEDALGRLLPPAMPLIGFGTVVATLAIWIMFGRSRSALFPILVTQSLLMFLVGHNLAILGLIDIPTDQRHRVLEFVGLTAFLAAAFAVSTSAISPPRFGRQRGRDSRPRPWISYRTG